MNKITLDRLHKYIIKGNIKNNDFIQVPRQKHFKNDIKIVKFEKDKTSYKKVRLFYKIYFNNNIFIIKEINNIKELENIKQYIKEIKLYCKITQYKKGCKKVLLVK
jgi:hypothetical protein